MNIGILLPGFSADEDDWAIPVQHNLIRALAEVEDVRVLALRYPHHRTPYTVYNAAVFPLGYTHQARGLRRLWLWWEALATLRRLHREKPFDVLHAIWGDETGLVAVQAGRQLGIPVVVTLAGGELAQLDDIGYGLQRSIFSRWIVGQAVTGADAVVTGCSYLRRLLAEARYPVQKSRLHSIAFGVDTQLFVPAPELTQLRHLVHVASLVPVKDQAMLLRAFARLPRDVTLQIVGDGPQRPYLEHLAQTLGVAGRVHFTGAVEYPDMPRHYQRAALQVLSSRHEGFGMVTLEAAACGVPTVGTDVGVLPDYPAMGPTVPVRDDAALASAINSLLEDETRRIALGKSARALVERQMTTAHTVEQLRELYTELTQGGRG